MKDYTYLVEVIRRPGGGRLDWEVIEHRTVSPTHTTMCWGLRSMVVANAMRMTESLLAKQGTNLRLELHFPDGKGGVDRQAYATDPRSGSK